MHVGSKCSSCTSPPKSTLTHIYLYHPPTPAWVHIYLHYPPTHTWVHIYLHYPPTHTPLHLGTNQFPSQYLNPIFHLLSRISTHERSVASDNPTDKRGERKVGRVAKMMTKNIPWDTIIGYVISGDEKETRKWSELLLLSHKLSLFALQFCLSIGLVITHTDQQSLLWLTLTE